MTLKKILLSVYSKQRAKKYPAVMDAQKEAFAKLGALDEAFETFYQRGRGERIELAQRALQISKSHDFTRSEFETIYPLAKGTAQSPQQLKESWGRVFGSYHVGMLEDEERPQATIEKFSGNTYADLLRVPKIVNRSYHGLPPSLEERNGLLYLRNEMKNVTSYFFEGYDIEVRGISKELYPLNIEELNEKWTSLFDCVENHREDYEVVKSTLKKVSKLSLDQARDLAREQGMYSKFDKLLHVQQAFSEPLSRVIAGLDTAKSAIPELFDDKNRQLYINEDKESVEARDAFVESQHQWVKSMGFDPTIRDIDVFYSGFKKVALSATIGAVAGYFTGDFETAAKWATITGLGAINYLMFNPLKRLRQ